MIKFLTARRAPTFAAEPPLLRRRVDLGAELPAYSIYAVGDVHGCADLLLSAENRIVEDAAINGTAALIILLGDYVDRGPASAQVLEHLSKPLTGNVKRLALCGNHDDLFLRFMRDPGHHREWLEMGGRQTLMSYGVGADDAPPEKVAERLVDAMPHEQVAFLESLPVYARIGNYLFVHAGIRPGIPLSDQTQSDLMWIREPFITVGPRLPLLVVHGHTPAKAPTTGPQRIGIDTGAYVTGHLSVLKIAPDGMPSFLPR